ncbi:YibE/F family protein [Acidaminobacter sp. JC074]|uniref:YibE/F family protein n=1 Tax=Acidaminobacter sp. JC074 TaxID=2530199 RepID=UPI001F0F542B|nr:YibE/F family protein [Acidaminobacter sp. JC074]MCH4888338.1 YibE/F family protein [Acidaminobacter sp. JC074]
MKKLLMILMILLLVTGSVFATDAEEADKLDQELEDYYEDSMRPEYTAVKARIIEITLDETKEERPDVPLQSDRRYQHIKIELITGSHTGEVYTVQNIIEMINPYKLIFEPEDKMLLRMFEDEDGQIYSLQIVEKVREQYVYAAVLGFLILLTVIGGKNGIKSVLSLIFTGGIIVLVLVPMILNGYNPILSSTFICIVTTVVTLLLIVGRNKKTLSAILGTVIGLMIAGFVVFVIGNGAQLTGLSGDEAQMLAYVPQKSFLDFKGILYAGILIGALGAIMDVTVSVASSMYEIESVHPEITTKELIKSGLNVGRDIMGSMSNTLILAYTGGALHLMLLFNAFNMSFTEIINMDMIASEVIRAVAGSTGLIMAIPLTAIISGFNRVKKV